MDWLQLLADSWQVVTVAVAVLDVLLVLVMVPWALSIKKEASSAVAWCLLIITVPLAGSVFFWLFGYQSVHRPLNRKRRQRLRFRARHPATAPEPAPGPEGGGPASAAGGPHEEGWEGMPRLARRLDAYPLSPGNAVAFHHEGNAALADMLAAVAAAKHHVHAEFYIFQPDDTGRRFVAALAERAAAGVEVRLLYDAMGSYRLGRSTVRPLLEAGGRAAAFLPLNPLRRRLQINLRNHRKILVVDGRVAFTGGMNVGDEYLGLDPHYGFWRDTHFRLEGPAVASLQRVFAEDWDFAASENLVGDAYYPEPVAAGPCPVQVVQSGPDQELKSIREVFFAAILRARRRVWIATPYFVPDAGLRDALALAGRSGVDVRLLCQMRPDKWVPFLAGRYYWADMLAAGVKVYQYRKGMMHAKTMLVDGRFAAVGSANLDNRSLLLNFEATCLFYDDAVAAELEAQFRRDLNESSRLDARTFAGRPLSSKIAENACRLLSPVL